MENESVIVELETLVPLFIKGKDPEYGEGSYSIGNNTYLLNNDSLCEFIYQRTYDQEGNLREEGKNYVAAYEAFMQMKTQEKLKDAYNDFSRELGRSASVVNVEENVPREFKQAFRNRSIQFFLDNSGLLRGHTESVIRSIAKAVTTLKPSNGDNKAFIQNGRGVRFIPGSSIKGAVRNALLWEILKEPNLHEELNSFVAYNMLNAHRLDSRGRRKFAEKFCQKKDAANRSFNLITSSVRTPTFRRSEREHNEIYLKGYNDRWAAASEVHRDLFRIVKISDAGFVGNPSLSSMKVQSYTLREDSGRVYFAIKNGTDTHLEVAAAGSRARFRITIDKLLASEFFGGTIPPFLNSVSALLQTVDAYFRAVAIEEMAFYNLASSPGRVAAVKRWYQNVFASSQDQGNEQAIIFRIGWGGGLMSKTQFLHLRDRDRKHIRNLTNDRGDAVAPKSRCLQANGNDAVTPLGWCSLRYVPADERNIAESPTQGGKTVMPVPPGCVTATIIDAATKPAKVRIEDGKYAGKTTILPGINLQGLGLTTESSVYVSLQVDRGQLTKAVYKGLP